MDLYLKINLYNKFSTLIFVSITIFSFSIRPVAATEIIINIKRKKQRYCPIVSKYSLYSLLKRCSAIDDAIIKTKMQVETNLN